MRGSPADPIASARMIVPLLFGGGVTLTPDSGWRPAAFERHAVKVAGLCERLTGRKVVVDISDPAVLVLEFLEVARAD